MIALAPTVIKVTIQKITETYLNIYVDVTNRLYAVK